MGPRSGHELGGLCHKIQQHEDAAHATSNEDTNEEPKSPRAPPALRDQRGEGGVSCLWGAYQGHTNV